MQTPFDDVIQAIAAKRYHNHRTPEHSNAVGEGIFRDLLQRCEALRADVEKEVVEHWLNVAAPGGRGRTLDLFVGEPDPESGKPDIRRLRIGIENKSVITAHRNRTSRYDDLSETLSAIFAERKEAIMVATILVGIAEKVLNVPDRLKPMAPDFEEAVLPRLSTGDQALWADYQFAVSVNSTADPAKTVDRFRDLPKRNPSFTHVLGYDYIEIVPVLIDNVNPPKLARENSLGIDIDSDYETMLNTVCNAYVARWHLDERLRTSTR